MGEKKERRGRGEGEERGRKNGEGERWILNENE